VNDSALAIVETFQGFGSRQHGLPTACLRTVDA
jgi:hypothetical protein